MYMSMSKNKEKKNKNPKPQLPHGWVVHVSKTYPDRVYYFNSITGCTTWEFPVATSESADKDQDTDTIGRDKVKNKRTECREEKHNKTVEKNRNNEDRWKKMSKKEKKKEKKKSEVKEKKEETKIPVKDKKKAEVHDKKEETKIVGKDKKKAEFQDKKEETKIAGKDKRKAEFQDKKEETKIAGKDKRKAEFQDKKEETKIAGKDKRKAEFQDKKEETKIPGKDKRKAEFQDKKEETKIAVKDKKKAEFQDKKEETKIAVKDKKKTEFQDKKEETKTPVKDKKKAEVQEKKKETKIPAKEKKEAEVQEKKKETKIPAKEKKEAEVKEKKEETKIRVKDKKEAEVKEETKIRVKDKKEAEVKEKKEETKVTNEPLHVAQSVNKAASTTEQLITSSELSSGPEDYVDEDDEPPAETIRKHHSYSSQKIEASRSSGFSLKSCLTDKKNNIQTYNSKHKDFSSSSAFVQPNVPITFTVKSVPKSKISSSKVKPSVHFADPPSPTFSTAETEINNDDHAMSPSSENHSTSSEPEYIVDAIDAMMPPSPPQNSILYNKILDADKLQVEPTKLKNTSSLFKTCQPFSVSEYKKTLEAKNIISPHRRSTTASTSIQNQETLAPVKLPSLPSSTTILKPPAVTCNSQKRKLSEEDIRGELLPHKKIALPLTSEINEIMGSNFILWNSDDICDKNNMQVNTPKSNDTIEVQNSENMILNTPKIPQTLFNFSSNINSPQSNLFNFTSLNAFQTSSLDNKTPSFNVSKPGSDSSIPGSTIFIGNEVQESIPSIASVHAENSNMKSVMDFEITKMTHESSPLNNKIQDETLPKIRKRSIDSEQDSIVARKNDFPKVSSSHMTLDCIGMETTSSCSSNVPVIHSMWENLLRPNNTNSNSARSFADFWSSSRDTQPVEEEDMEWESENTATKVSNEEESKKDYDNYSLTAWHIIVDTNIILYDVKYIEELRDTQFEDFGFPIIVIPWVVLQELDNLKAPRSKSSEALQNMGKARAAVSFILENLNTEHPRMKGQSYDEFSHYNYTSCVNNDDKILHFCSSLQKKGCHLTLLTEDKNLRVKAITSRVEACSKSELKRKHVPLSTNIFTFSADNQHSNQDDMEVTNASHTDNAKANEILCKTKTILLKVLKQFLVYGMKKISETMWQRFVVKKPPWSLVDCLYCLRYHWIAIFKFELSPNAQGLIEDLDKMLRQQKGYGQSLSEVTSVVESAISLCSCISHNKFQPQLVTQIITQLRQLLVACHGGEIEPSNNSSICSDSLTAANILTTTSQVETRDSSRQTLVPQEELLEVQKHFTVLWERAHSFCGKLQNIMSNVGDTSSQGVDAEIEKNISAILRTVKQFVQLNQKLLNNSKISPSCREIQEVYSILLNDSVGFDEDSFSCEALCEFYNQRREELKQAQTSFESFVTVINKGVRFLMSKTK